MSETLLEAPPEIAAVPVSREVVRTLSIAGMTDADIEKRFQGLKGATIRKWRERDPVWRAAFTSTRIPKVSRDAVTKAENEAKKASQAAIAVTQTLSETHAKTALTIVNATAQALDAFAQDPSQIKNWQDASTAYKMQRLAAGIDKEGAQVSVNLAMFGHAQQSQGEDWETEGPVVEVPGEGE